MAVEARVIDISGILPSVSQNPTPEEIAGHIKTVSHLVRVITRTVNPNVWEAGGGNSTISAVQDGQTKKWKLSLWSEKTDFDAVVKQITAIGAP